MAVVVLTKKLCDVCLAAGKDESVQATTTRRFGLDGDRLEVDVCDKHSDELSSVLSSWVRASRKQGSKPRNVTPKSGKPVAAGRKPKLEYDPEAVRQWALDKGYKVKPEPGSKIAPRIIGAWRAEQEAKAS